jgi:hypothetical protein
MLPMSKTANDEDGNETRAQLAKAEKLLAEIRDGKHSIQGVLRQVERYFADRGEQPPRQ